MLYRRGGAPERTRRVAKYQMLATVDGKGNSYRSGGRVRKSLIDALLSELDSGKIDEISGALAKVRSAYGPAAEAPRALTMSFEKPPEFPDPANFNAVNAMLTNLSALQKLVDPVMAETGHSGMPVLDGSTQHCVTPAWQFESPRGDPTRRSAAKAAEWANSGARTLGNLIGDIVETATTIPPGEAGPARRLHVRPCRPDRRRRTRCGPDGGARVPRGAQ